MLKQWERCESNEVWTFVMAYNGTNLENILLFQHGYNTTMESSILVYHLTTFNYFQVRALAATHRLRHLTRRDARTSERLSLRSAKAAFNTSLFQWTTHPRASMSSKRTHTCLPIVLLTLCTSVWVCLCVYLGVSVCVFYVCFCLGSPTAHGWQCVEKVNEELKNLRHLRKEKVSFVSVRTCVYVPYDTHTCKTTHNT